MLARLIEDLLLDLAWESPDHALVPAPHRDHVRLHHDRAVRRDRLVPAQKLTRTLSPFRPHENPLYPGDARGLRDPVVGVHARPGELGGAAVEQNFDLRHTFARRLVLLRYLHRTHALHGRHARDRAGDEPQRRGAVARLIAAELGSGVPYVVLAVVLRTSTRGGRHGLRLLPPLDRRLSQVRDEPLVVVVIISGRVLQVRVPVPDLGVRVRCELRRPGRLAARDVPDLRVRVRHERRRPGGLTARAVLVGVAVAELAHLGLGAHGGDHLHHLRLLGRQRDSRRPDRCPEENVGHADPDGPADSGVLPPVPSLRLHGLA